MLIKKEVSMKSSNKSQFGEFPLIYVFEDTGMNSKINHLHNRSLSIISGCSISSFKDWHKKSN